MNTCLKYGLMVWLIACLGGTGGCGHAYAQTAPGEGHTLVLRGVPLSQALEQLVRLTQVDLVYSSDLVAGKHVYCAGRAVSAEALLRCVLAGSGLDYVRSSAGTYVLIEALHQPSRFGDLAGRVVDGSNGAPLPHAHVLLADARTGTASNEAGLFSFSSVLSGMHRLVVTYVGYETAVDSVWVEGGAQQRLQIALRPRAVPLEPVVIDGLAQRLPSGLLGAGTLTRRQLSAFQAGGTPDVARGAARLPGVAQQQPLADLHIQGGATGEHLVLLDGVPVRSPVSLGRHLSAFSPLALDRLTVHKAGFGAEHGSHLSGVVEVEQAVTGPAYPSLLVSADPVSLNGKLQSRLALPGGQQGALMLAARSSLWDVYRDPGVEDLLRRWNAVDPLLAALWIREDVNAASLGQRLHRPDVAFSDVHAALRLPLTPFRTLYASAYRARNRISSELTAVNADAPSDPDRLILTRDDYDWTNWAAQVRYHWLIGARSIASVRAQGSWHASRYVYHSLHAPVADATSPALVEQRAQALRADLDAAPGSDELNRIAEVSVKAGLNHSLSPRHHVEAALAATRVESRFRVGNQFVAPFADEAAAWDLSGHVQGKLALGLRTTLEPGLRLTYLPARRTVYAEPRLALRHDGSSSLVGPYALRLAGGLYRQFVNQFELSSSGSTSVVPSVLFWLPVERSLAPPRAYHLAAEALLLPGAAWTLRLEGYYKAQPRLLTLDYAALLAEYPSTRPRPPPVTLEQADFISATRGRSYGGGVRLEGSLWPLSGTLSYSFSQALLRFPGRFDERLVPAPWNRPHRLLLDARIALATHLSADLAWQGAWGQRWAFRRAYYDYLALRADPVSFVPFDLHQPADQVRAPYTRLDAGLAYERSWGRASVQLRAFVVNVLDRRNVFDWSLEQTDAGLSRMARTLPGRHPVFAVRLGY